MVLTRLQASNKLFRIEISTDRVSLELLRFHEIGSCVHGVKAVDLCLKLIPVWVLVINRDGDAMMDTPHWQHSLCLPLAVRECEILQGVESESHMFQSSTCGDLIPRSRYGADGDS